MKTIETVEDGKLDTKKNVFQVTTTFDLSHGRMSRPQRFFSKNLNGTKPGFLHPRFEQHFLNNLSCFFAPQPWPARGIELSGFPYVRLSLDQVKIFVQGRISRPINGSKLILHKRIYLYETSRKLLAP